MVRDNDALGSAEEDDDFDAELLNAALETAAVDVNSHVHIDVGGGGPRDDRGEDIETEENIATEAKNVRTEIEIQRPVRGCRVSYRTHFQSATALAEFRDTYRIPNDVTLQLFPLGIEAKPRPLEVTVPLAGSVSEGSHFHSQSSFEAFLML